MIFSDMLLGQSPQALLLARRPLDLPWLSSLPSFPFMSSLMADLMLQPEWTELTIVIYPFYLPLDMLHLPIGKLSLIFHNKALSVSESTKS